MQVGFPIDTKSESRASRLGLCMTGEFMNRISMFVKVSDDYSNILFGWSLGLKKNCLCCKHLCG